MGFDTVSFLLINAVLKCNSNKQLPSRIYHQLILAGYRWCEVWGLELAGLNSYRFIEVMV